MELFDQNAAGCVGIIGTGRIGIAIGQRLSDTRHDLVVWNRTATRAQPLRERGARIVETCRAVVEQCETIIVVVRDSDSIRDVYFGPAGLCAGSLAGRVIVEMTTATIEIVKQAGTAVKAAGGRFIDAPISGTVTPARNGELIVMAGGPDEDLAAARPVLEHLARKLVHVGPVGAGIAMKLVLNLPLASYWQTLGEALALGQKNGLELGAMLSLIVESKAAVGALQSKLPKILDAGSSVEFDLAGMYKDLLCMQESAAAAGLDLPASAAAARSAGQAVQHGWGDRDLAQLVRFVADGIGRSEK
ncbi:NAD(P)-dependent oxidoreductase [Bradyrhizobium sp. Leo121]|uniref:NAD(P)-dependent oxidoreductase n=1 Tax=Bradyrhizobium sp. Leo121 TaxID=1571195 RepID=UPI0013EF4387|nr:NAD(P)-dependent oxidoreductase [Bradyrhizobium sp. Leo121]